MNLPVYEFHVSADVRSRYKLRESLFSTNGHVIFADFGAVRHFVHQVNQHRQPDTYLFPGEVNAAGLIDEIFHMVLRYYENFINPDVFEKAVKALQNELGSDEVSHVLGDFTKAFPPTNVYNFGISPVNHLRGYTGTRSNLAIAAEEALILYLDNLNPANLKLREFFDLGQLENPEAFNRFIQVLVDFLKSQPPIGPDQNDLITFLMTPFLVSPQSLFAQLEYITRHWKAFMPEDLVIRLLRGTDLMKEDYQLSPGAGHAPSIVPVYGRDAAHEAGIGKSGFGYASYAARTYQEYEKFTPDTDWMPKVVLIAKNTYVWLDQLSKKYQREIRKLDQIPDEVLDQLARWHFNALWLIGIWERSPASKRIKHIMGNIDAVSSAYSLYDYDIAADLGGEEAYRNLNERARARGIRLASDMVPNHTGLYSRWVIEYPDYFIQTNISPFPGYRFNGENLSLDPNIEIRIEDGYYTRSDAAVVFQRIDRRNGEIRYIYHGNDGTNMPWNDTAQLNMIRKEVREAVIQKIFEVARRFSIIRFDAAMTLAKKHFARLWYPVPGTGGDIPSRSDFSMTQDEFDALFPEEFWREVVDRMNAEMPETLLLAEAFWLMEGYFVRTLGMHRVYNSAFMHMLKNEENEKYRDLITNTLEFEPEILKRYVNFMSNPDEETAIRQFGTGDKYFGVCVLMTTLPGLPMFAHGQVEGFTEKYGMEYQRAYYNEQPDIWLVQRHEKEIFPLTRRRYLFSEVEHFNLYDYIKEDGSVNENVYAFTNRSGNERALVLYNNKYDSTSGYIRMSCTKLTRNGDKKEPVVVNLGEALGLNPQPGYYYILKEHISGLEYLRTGKQLYEDGFRWALQGFEYRVFIDFTEVYDHGKGYEEVARELEGRGVQSIDSFIASRRLKTVHEKLKHLLEVQDMEFLISSSINQPGEILEKVEFAEITRRFEGLIESVRPFLPKLPDEEVIRNRFISAVLSIWKSNKYLNDSLATWQPVMSKYRIKSPGNLLVTGDNHSYRANLLLLLTFFSLRDLSPSQAADSLIESLHLKQPLTDAFRRTGRSEHDINLDLLLLSSLLKFHNASRGKVQDMIPSPGNTRIFAELLNDASVQEFLGVNEYQGVVYYSKENIEELTDWLHSLSFMTRFETGEPGFDEFTDELAVLTRNWIALKELSEKCGYRFQKLQDELMKIES